MKKTIKIKGMMCNHCVSTVKKALSAINGVEEVEVSLENGTAEVKAISTVTNEDLKNAIENVDFEVVSID